MRFSVLFLIAVLISTFSFAGQLLDIQNPGFEIDTDKNNIPDGWTLTPKKPPHHEIGTLADLKSWYKDDVISHTDRSSLKAGNSSELDEGFWKQDDILIPSDAKYLKVTAWIKSENLRTS